MARTGTYTLEDLLENRFQNVNAVEFGLDTIAETIERDLSAHRRIAEELVSEFAVVTEDLQRIYGTAVDGRMVEVDEFGRSATQKDRPGDTVGFPYRRYQFALGWTRRFLELASVRDLAIATATAQKADVAGIRREVKRALFHAANYSFVDYMATGTTLAVKRLLNADGAPVPPGPNGELFDGGAHTHYMARAGGALAASDVTALITNVVEHGHSEGIRIAINKADEATVSGLSTFKPYVDFRLTLNQAANQPRTQVDTLPVDNRPIGLIEGAEVWIKPWGVSGYLICWESGGPAKPLAMRVPKQAGMRGLRLAGEISTHPLLTQYMEHDYGVGVWTRTAAAILYIGGTTWQDPTLN